MGALLIKHFICVEFLAILPNGCIGFRRDQAVVVAAGDIGA